MLLVVPTPSSALEAPLERRVLLLVTLVQLVNVLDFVMVMPLGRDFARSLGFPESQLGLIGGAYTLSAAVAGLAGARFLDRADRRTALSISMAGLVAATAAGGFAFDLTSMLIARVIAGAFGGPATSVALAIVADIVPVERRGKAMSLVSAAFSIASVVGVPLAIYAAEIGSWRTPFFAVAAMGALVTVFAASSLPSLRVHLAGERPPPAATWSLVRRPEMAMTLSAAAAMTLSIFMIVPYVRSFLQNNHHYPESQIKYLYLVGGVAAFVTVRLAGPAVDRFGSTPIAAIGTVVLAVSQVVWFVPEQPILPTMLVFVMFMTTASLRGVPLSTLASKLPAPYERAQYMSLQSAVQHLASATGAIAASWILTTGPGERIENLPLVVLISICLAACLPILMWRTERRVRARQLAAKQAAT